MPEGDTVHKLAAYLQPRLAGRSLASGRAEVGKRVDLAGRTIEEVRALGKHLLMTLDDGRILRSHLGMWGSWHHYQQGQTWKRPSREAAIVLGVDDEVYVCFKPKEVELLRSRGVRARILSIRLGPDLISVDTDIDAIVKRARDMLEPETPIIDVLLDQRPACGIGNVYKSEVLFLERTPPLESLGALQDAALRRLYTRARELLMANLGGGPRVTRHEGDGGQLWVYGRKGLPCYRCGHTIDYALMGRDRRSTYWCTGCQGERPATTAAAREADTEIGS